MKSFDLASTTGVDQEVLDTYVKAVMEFNTHPDSDPALIKLRQDVKHKIKQLLNVEHDLCFTSGGTEANNLAIIGYAKQLNSTKHFITSSYEHPSVLNSFKYLETLGHKVSYITPNKEGVITAEMVKEYLEDDTVLVSIMSVNNEIGSINDLVSISQVVKAHNPHTLMMSDCVQGITHIDLSVLNHLDLWTISAHKLHGLKGCGLLGFKPNVVLHPILCGGHNENGLRPGTQDLAREIAFLKAIEKYVVNRQANVLAYLVEQLQLIPGININCPSTTHIVNISVDSPMLAESIKSYLYDQGYMTSTKSACASMTDSRSLTLQALGLANDAIDHSIRISIDSLTTKESIDDFIKVLKNVIK